jgi:PAS domain S-box-containing protein
MKPNPFLVTTSQADPVDIAPKGSERNAESVARRDPALGQPAQHHVNQPHANQPRPEQLQQAFAKELLEFGPAIFLADMRGEIRWSNAAFRKIAETKSGAVSFGAALPLKDIAEEIDLKRQPLFREDRIGGAVLRSRHVPLFDDRGAPNGFGGMVNLIQPGADRAEDNPVTLERHMDFIRLSSDWMWETDAEFNFQMVTHRVSNVLGRSPHEMIGGNLLSLVSSEPLRQALRRKLQRLSPFRDQPFDAEDSDGRRKLFLMSAAPVFDKADGSLKGYRGAATDITELTRREESLRSAKEAAEVASRAKSHFLANMSHELRTPLNAIIGFTDVMRMGLLGPVENPEYRTYVSDIHGSAQKLLEVINDILDMSRIETGEVELHEAACNVEELFESARRIVNSRIEARGIRFTCEIAPRLPRLHADKRKMKQILVNLLSNAVKFTEPGGRVKLSAALAEGGGLKLMVEDNGIGIAAEHLDKVMEPFAQVEADLDRRFEGIGMGLPLSRGLARLHGGDLILESRPGTGTRAIVTLPAERVIEGHHLTAVK